MLLKLRVQLTFNLLRNRKGITCVLTKHYNSYMLHQSHKVSIIDSFSLRNFALLCKTLRNSPRNHKGYGEFIYRAKL